MNSRALLAVALTIAGYALGQRPSFEAASVKPASGQLTGLNPEATPPKPEHFTARFAPLGWLIRVAYDLEDYQISGPSVLDSRFDVEATAAPGTAKEQRNLMLQTLLEERFHLAFHYVTKEMSAYNMVVGKNGLKLRDSVLVRRCAGRGQPLQGLPPCPADPEQLGIARSTIEGPGSMTSPGASIGHLAFGRNVHMKALANVAHEALGGIPVFDKTGLTGSFDIRMEFASTTAPDDTPYPSIVNALDQQLGLKLEPLKAQVQVMIVDHADSVPVPN